MTLRDDITALAAAGVRHTCNVARVLTEVATSEGDDVAQQFRDLVDASNVGAQRLISVLRRNGYRLGHDSVLAHRRGECDCHEPG